MLYKTNTYDSKLKIINMDASRWFNKSLGGHTCNYGSSTEIQPKRSVVIASSGRAH